MDAQTADLRDALQQGSRSADIEAGELGWLHIVHICRPSVWESSIGTQVEIKKENHASLPAAGQVQADGVAVSLRRGGEATAMTREGRCDGERTKLH